MKEYFYYIIKGTWTTDKEGLKEGVRISKIPIELISNDAKFLNFNQGNGPYKSLRSLKKNSFIFKQLASANSKRASQILDEKNINEVKSLIATSKNQKYPLEFISLIDHTIRGRIKNGRLTGIHFYDKNRIKILKEIETNNCDVWKAKFKIRHPKTNLWIEKDQETTFFPKNWDEHKLFHELYYAFLNKKKLDKANHIFRSKTLSGIKVEIIKNSGVFKSIYPKI